MPAAPPRRLRKHEVEALVGLLADPEGDVPDRGVDALVAGLGAALATVLGRDPASPWSELVDAATARARWDDARHRALLAAPTGGADGLAALWDLAAELNERRDLGDDRARARRAPAR